MLYDGDPRTRPMKDRVREAVFNLVGDRAAGVWAIDLFAGTGVLGLEALSRGAARATLIERHVPTAQTIERTVAELRVADAVQVVSAGDAFFWVKRHAEAIASTPSIVFCSPPYDFYVERVGPISELIESMVAGTPTGSTIVVESDSRFDVNSLPRREDWETRIYPPAVVSILRKS